MQFSGEFPEAGRCPGQPCVLHKSNQRTAWAAGLWWWDTVGEPSDACSAFSPLTSLLWGKETVNPGNVDSCLRKNRNRTAGTVQVLRASQGQPGVHRYSTSPGQGWKGGSIKARCLKLKPLQQGKNDRRD